MTGCDVFYDAIGDLDYDGSSYRADWPTSTTAGTFPGAFAEAQPTSRGDAQYGSVTPSSLGAFTSPIERNPRCQT